MKTFLQIASSLKLTVLLLVLSMALVFFGTLDQVHYGVFETQRRYFESFFVVWHFPNSPFGIPLIGGYLLGILLLINLFAAHFKYFRATWKKLGIMLIHLGIVLLLISGFTTSTLQEETQMWLEENKTTHYSSSLHENELVIIDKSHPESDQVYSIPTKLIQSKKWINLTNDLKVRAHKYYPNATLSIQNQDPKAPPSIATQGASLKIGLTASPLPPSYKDDQPNAITAFIEVQSHNHSLGIWLVSNIIDERFPPQTFNIDGKTYEIALRFKRTYFPFSLKLLEFTHEKHPGTDIPKYFSSKVLLNEPNKQERQVLIYMNNPLRYNGYTFYQASFANNDKASMLQVVKNPSRLMPYISILLVSLGLFYHFILKLLSHLKRK